MRSSRAKGIVLTQAPRMGNARRPRGPRSLAEPELRLAVRADARGMPGRLEHDVDGDVRLAQCLDVLLHVLRNLPRRRTALRGQRHADRDLRLVDVDAVDEPEVVDVDGD